MTPTSNPDTLGTDYHLLNYNSNIIIIYLWQSHVSYLDQIQVFIVQHPPEVQEGDTIEVCLQTTRIVTEPLYFHIETTTTKYTPAAIGKTDNEASMYILCVLLISFSWLRLQNIYFYS